MQYSDAIDYLYSRLPVFHRIGPKALKPGLGNTLALCEALGNPQHQFRSIHVAGTNGKGSSSHMLAAVYQAAGYRVGLYTSPHLQSFTERIRINGQPVAEAEVAQFVEQHQALIEAVEPSFFEATVAMAFSIFARHALDVAIIEVGLGGRLDSTNVIRPVASLITNIGFDHTDILGDTLPAIAREKAGIIKPDTPVVVSETQPETEPVFSNVALLLNAPLLFADQQYTLRDLGITAGQRQVVVQRIGAEENESVRVGLDLVGTYQVRNLAGVWAIVAALQETWPVSVAQLQYGLANVTHLTGLKGRFQTLQDRPRIIADTAHNPPGLVALWATLATLPYQTLRVVLGLVADKDRANVLAVLPPTAVYYFCQAHTPRALPAAELQAEAAQVGRYGAAYPDVNQALEAACQQAQSDDLILITGSNYTVAELRHL